MKKEIIFSALVCFLFASSFVSADTSYYEETFETVKTAGSSTVELVKLRYEPYPASPGDYMTLYLQAEKVGATAKDIRFELIEDYPFSLDANENAVREYDNLQAETVVLEYKIRIDDSAVSGNNSLRIRQVLDSGNSIIHEFTINIQDVQTSFDAVVQESSSDETTIAIANIGQNDANAAIVRIPDQDGVSVSGTNGQMIGNLEQGDYTVVSFELQGAKSSFDLQIDYTDAIGFRRSEIIEITLGSEGMTAASTGNDSAQGMAGQGMGEFGSQSGSSSKIYCIAGASIIIVASLIFWGYKHHKNKNKSKGRSLDWMKKKS